MVSLIWWQFILILVAVGTFTVATMCILFARRQQPDAEDFWVEQLKIRDKTIANQQDEISRLKKLMKIKGVLQ